MSGSTLDIVLALWLVYAMYHGFTKGLIITLSSLLGLALGIYGAIKFAWVAGDFMKEQWDIDIAALSFVITFLLILWAVHLLGKALEKVVNVLAMGFLNKIGGALFNGVKMLLVASTLFFIFQQVTTKYNFIDFPSFEGSIGLPLLTEVAEIIKPFAQGIFGEDLPSI